MKYFSCLIFIQLLMVSCTQTSKEYFENGVLKSEFVSKDHRNGILKTFNQNGQLVAEYTIMDSVKNGISKHYNSSGADFEIDWVNGEQSMFINDMSGENQINLKHNCPDTLFSGDKVKAKISSKNEKWKITEAFANCPVGEDGIFRIQHRSKLECMRLLIEDGLVSIEFRTKGTGNKSFLPITIILENKDGIRQSRELKINYFLKEKTQANNGEHP